MKRIFLSLVSVTLCAALTLGLTSCFTIDVQMITHNAETEALYDEQNYAAEQDVYTETPTVEETTEFINETVSFEYPKELETQPQTEAQTEAQTAAPSTPDKMTGQALLSYFNDSVNTIKAKKAGFKKSKLTTVKDLQLSNKAANTLVSFVKGALLSETADETTVNKGQSSDNVLSPSGKAYASALTMSDIKNISAVKSGSGYVITVNLKDEQNPTSTGVYSKCMDFITVDDVVSVYAPKVGATVSKENITVKLTNSYAKLTVDASGTPTAYETLVNGVLSMKNASIKKVVTINTDLDITLSSTTTYTGFSF